MSNFGGVSVVRAVRRRWMMICLLAAIAVSLATWVSLGLLTKRYQAATTLLVQPLISTEGISYDALMTNERLAVTYGEIIKSYTTARSVILSLGLKVTETQLLKELVVAPVKDSLVLALKVTDPDPALAMKIADAFASTFVQDLPRIMHVENVSVLDKARLVNAGRPVSPNPVFYVGVALFLAVNTGVGLSILLEFLDRTIEDEDSLEQVLGAPVLSAIPAYPAPIVVEGGNRRPVRRVHCIEEPKSEVAEAFRALRTGIRHIPFDDEIRTILVISPLPLEGKTSVSAGLAACLAQEGRNVLLIDCDLHHPAVHEVFHLSNEIGLTDVLAAKQTVPACVFPTAVPGLEVLPAGPPPEDPASMLSKVEFSALLSSLRETYDMVIVDSPPLLPVADGQILGKLCDGTLLVIRAYTTQAENVRRSRRLLVRVGARIMGAVLNAKRTNRRGSHGYNGYYGRGGYYGHSEGPSK